MTERTGGRGKCAVCLHNEQNAINAALVAGKPSLGKLAETYGITKTSLIRHKASHVSPALAKVQAKRIEQGATTVVARLERLVQRLEGYVTVAEGAPATKTAPEQPANLNLALLAIRELRSTIELLAKVTGELDDRPTTVVNVMASQEWIQVRAIVVKALSPFPEAMRAVAGKLERIE